MRIHHSSARRRNLWDCQSWAADQHWTHNADNCNGTAAQKFPLS